MRTPLAIAALSAILLMSLPGCVGEIRSPSRPVQVKTHELPLYEAPFAETLFYQVIDERETTPNRTFNLISHLVVPFRERCPMEIYGRPDELVVRPIAQDAPKVGFQELLAYAVCKNLYMQRGVSRVDELCPEQNKAARFVLTLRLKNTYYEQGFLSWYAPLAAAVPTYVVGVPARYYDFKYRVELTLEDRREDRPSIILAKYYDNNEYLDNLEIGEENHLMREEGIFQRLLQTFVNRTSKDFCQAVYLEVEKGREQPKILASNETPWRK